MVAASRDLVLSGFGFVQWSRRQQFETMRSRFRIQQQWLGQANGADQIRVQNSGASGSWEAAGHRFWSGEPSGSDAGSENELIQAAKTALARRSYRPSASALVRHLIFPINFAFNFTNPIYWMNLWGKIELMELSKKSWVRLGSGRGRWGKGWRGWSWEKERAADWGRRRPKRNP